MVPLCRDGMSGGMILMHGNESWFKITKIAQFSQCSCEKSLKTKSSLNSHNNCVNQQDLINNISVPSIAV